MNTIRKIGNLMLLEVKKQKEENDIIKNGNTIRRLNDSFRWEFRDYSFPAVAENWKPVEPIIICDDKIKIGDKAFHTKRNKIISVENYHLNTNETIFIKKIIVSPNQFTPEFLNAIINEKIKHNDKVEVAIEQYAKVKEDTNWVYKGRSLKILENKGLIKFGEEYGEQYKLCLKGTGLPNSESRSPFTFIHAKDLEISEPIIKLRKDNTAIIHPYDETMEEAAKNYQKFLVESGKDLSHSLEAMYGFMAGVKWKEEQRQK